MTETPVQPTEEQAPEPQQVSCHHCGAPNPTPQLPGADWLCTACERYQDSMTCPTCHSVVRASLMKAEV